MFLGLGEKSSSMRRERSSENGEITWERNEHFWVGLQGGSNRGTTGHKEKAERPHKQGGLCALRASIFSSNLKQIPPYYNIHFTATMTVGPLHLFTKHMVILSITSLLSPSLLHYDPSWRPL
jgi:hypothetical protein